MFTVDKHSGGFAVHKENKIMNTPGGKPLVLSTKAMAEAIAEEWKTQKKFSTQNMPLTALAYTAIDRVDGQKEGMSEILLAYVDTDTLCYRSSTSAINERQKKAWDPILQWAEKIFGEVWETTTGINPLSQSEALHENLRNYLAKQDAMNLAATALLASYYSSLALALAVLEKHISAEEAYHLSRLEEEVQAEQWGKDDEAQKRTARGLSETAATGRFLKLLDAA